MAAAISQWVSGIVAPLEAQSRFMQRAGVAFPGKNIGYHYGDTYEMVYGRAFASIMNEDRNAIVFPVARGQSQKEAVDSRSYQSRQIADLSFTQALTILVLASWLEFLNQLRDAIEIHRNAINGRIIAANAWALRIAILPPFNVRANALTHAIQDIMALGEHPEDTRCFLPNGGTTDRPVAVEFANDFMSLRVVGIDSLLRTCFNMIRCQEGEQGDNNTRLHEIEIFLNAVEALAPVPVIAGPMGPLTPAEAAAAIIAAGAAATAAAARTAALAALLAAPGNVQFLMPAAL